MLLHPYQDTLEIEIPREKEVRETSPGWELSALLYGVNDWLRISTSPCTCGSQGRKAIYVLYRNVALILTDFWDIFAPTMARINRDWPICAFGTAENQDSVRLSVREEENSIRLVQQTISGESTEVIRTLCFQISFPDSQTADVLLHLFEATDWRIGAAAMSWQELDFLREQRLVIEPESRSHFCYAGVRTEVTGKDLLDSLSFRQKISLWTAFLKDHFEPVEFEWLVNAISKDLLGNRMEWELALRETMDQLHFTVINQNRDFEIYDGNGKRRYFGADLRHPAEWAFLKILFPLNY